MRSVRRCGLCSGVHGIEVVCCCIGGEGVWSCGGRGSTGNISRGCRLCNSGAIGSLLFTLASHLCALSSHTPSFCYPHSPLARASPSCSRSRPPLALSSFPRVYAWFSSLGLCAYKQGVNTSRRRGPATSIRHTAKSMRRSRMGVTTRRTTALPTVLVRISRGEKRVVARGSGFCCRAPPDVAASTSLRAHWIGGARGGKGL